MAPMTRCSDPGFRSIRIGVMRRLRVAPLAFLLGAVVGSGDRSGQISAMASPALGRRLRVPLHLVKDIDPAPLSQETGFGGSSLTTIGDVAYVEGGGSGGPLG